MGRLDDIVDRNKNPRKHRRAMFPISIGLSLFVLFIIISMVCTDLSDPPKPATPAATETAPPEKGRVRGIGLSVEPAHRKAGSGSATGGSGAGSGR